TTTAADGNQTPIAFTSADVTVTDASQKDDVWTIHIGSHTGTYTVLTGNSPTDVANGLWSSLVANGLTGATSSSGVIHVSAAMGFTVSISVAGTAPTGMVTIGGTPTTPTSVDLWTSETIEIDDSAVLAGERWQLRLSDGNPSDNLTL